MIRNTITDTPGGFTLRSSDRRWGRIAASTFLTLNFAVATWTSAGSPASQGLYAGGFLAFLFFALYDAVFSQCAKVADGEIVLYSYWPLPLVQARVNVAALSSVRITALFTTESRRATVFLSLWTGGRRPVQQAYPCLRVEMNELVRALEKRFGTLGTEVVVQNDNTVE